MTGGVCREMKRGNLRLSQRERCGRHLKYAMVPAAREIYSFQQASEPSCFYLKSAVELRCKRDETMGRGLHFAYWYLEWEAWTYQTCVLSYLDTMRRIAMPMVGALEM